MIESIPQPGLTGKTVVVLEAADAHGPAVCGSLLASGATVVATGRDTKLPAPLVDAGTGLPGELHYRPLISDGAWPAVAEWIGARTASVHGIVGPSDQVGAVAEALGSQLATGAAIVSVDLATVAPAAARPGIRSSAVVLAGGRGSRPDNVGSAVAFLLSDLAELVDGAVIPIGERPANRI
jgi:NAD(P)-dependent dehydrogenase (short-subunit alcohol dehydrogenase family)